jgi:uncharacterized protein (TIGR02145 family)
MSSQTANDNNGVAFTALNPNGKPEVYTGTPPVTLTFKLTNNTGGDVAFTSGAKAATMEIYMPQCFLLSDLQKMSISLSDWTFSVNSSDVSLMLLYSGSGAVWNNGAVFSFDVSGVQTNAQPNTDTAQVNFINLPASLHGQVTAPLSVSNPPVPGNGDLTKVLQVSLDNQGGVIVSPGGDPLQNSVFLNIKNIGDNALYTGTNMWKGDPKITVVFVYGSSTGSLAPDEKVSGSPPVGSAWNIAATIPFQPPLNNWSPPVNPQMSGTDAHPRWLLKPSNINKGIIGTGDNANITFDFSNIISFTPPGHTQMIVQFTGFMKDDTTPYNDAVFVLDMVKQEAPPTRGLIYFYSPNPLFAINQPDTVVTVPLRWAMFDVASVQIITTYPGMKPQTINYPNPPSIGYDNLQIAIPGVTQSTGIVITIQAYNGTGGFLNSMQFTVYVQANMFVDPRDGKVYPVVQVKKRFWMSANLDYVAPAGSSAYGPENEYGRLYNYSAAQLQNNTGGWRLPNKADWQDLLSSFSYADLIKGGASGFNALFGGWQDNNNNNSNFGEAGYYWTGVNNGGNVEYVSFSNRSGSDSYNASPNGLPVNFSLAVRYVKDVS